MGTGPAERTHLFEYGFLAVLLHQALTERVRNGRHVPIPAILAVASTALLGWLDEGIQAILPDRVYDLRDVGVNALAGLMAILASQALAWARRRDILGVRAR
jgi:VanZ family protein